MKKVKLFCFPYAGGSASVYNKWKIFADEAVEIFPIELAGRGKRIREPFYETVNDALKDMLALIDPYLDGAPYAFWGHSMGSLITFELYHAIIKNEKKEPVHLFVSGRYPPSVTGQSKILHNLPAETFKYEIMNMGGTQNGIFENKELSDIFLPILKADYKLIEEYKYVERNGKINCRITAFTGKEDTLVTQDDMRQWEQHTSNKFELYEFNGGHFFINDHAGEIMEIINRKLKELLLFYGGEGGQNAG